MNGLVVHHKTSLYAGVLADRYRNDPYVWKSPFLWSFCHLKQNPKVTQNMPILWVSRVRSEYLCDLVFVVKEALSFREGFARYGRWPLRRRREHFLEGIRNHPEVLRPNARLYVADMEASFMPHPAVAIDVLVDRIRREQDTEAASLIKAFWRPSVPLKIVNIDPLVEYVSRQAIEKLKLAPAAMGDDDNSRAPQQWGRGLSGHPTQPKWGFQWGRRHV
jgi:hypothetical protein